MSDPFTDLRHVLARQHDRLKSELRNCKDEQQAKILRVRRNMVWLIWRDLLFFNRPDGAADVGPTSSPET
jgi:hypothetical protein